MVIGEAAEAREEEQVTEIIKTFSHRDGRLRANIVRRSNGTYGFTEEELRDTVEWFPLPAYFHAPMSICDSVETAEREIKQRVDWLRWLGLQSI
jgi:hypothetical protein